MIVALAQILDDAGAGTWNPTGSYSSSAVGIFYGDIQPAPDRAIGLTRYNGGPTQTYDGDRGSRFVQARLRGAPGSKKSADDLADAVDAVLRRMTRVSGLSSRWVSGPLPLGTDGNRRTELSLNYLVTLED